MKKRIALVIFISMLITVSIAQHPLQGIEYGNGNNISECNDTSNYQHTLNPQIEDSIYSCRDTIEIGYIFIDANPDTLFHLFPNVPNPFSDETNFRFRLPDDNFVEVSIYSLYGKQVDVLPTYFLDRGTHSLTYRNSNLSTGIYYYRVKIDGGVKVGKMMVVR